MPGAGPGGCATGWIRPGAPASGTARPCCSPATWTARGPRHGRAAPRDARRRRAARPGAAMAAAAPGWTRACAGPISTPRRRRGAPARCVPGTARCPAAKAICTAPACASAMNAPGARTGPSRLRRSPPGPARWPGLRNAGSGAVTGRASPGAGCAVSTTSGCTAGASWPVTSWPPGWPASGPAWGCTSSPLPGCRSCCA